MADDAPVAVVEGPKGKAEIFEVFGDGRKAYPKTNLAGAHQRHVRPAARQFFGHARPHAASTRE